jgi:redox-sensing transcriptional repressor
MLERFGFKIENVFDNNPEVIGKVISGSEVLDISHVKDIFKKKNIEISILAVPPDSAQKVADILVGAGVKVVINYTSVPVKAPPNVRIETTDPIEKLLHTLYYLSHTGYAGYK